MSFFTAARWLADPPMIDGSRGALTNLTALSQTIFLKGTCLFSKSFSRRIFRDVKHDQ